MYVEDHDEMEIRDAQDILYLSRNDRGNDAVIFFCRCSFREDAAGRSKKGQVCIASRGKVKKLYLEVSPERNRE